MLDSGTWSGKIFNGSWVDAQGGTVEVIEPATGDVIATSGAADAADVASACQAAAAAQPGWAATPGIERARIIRTAGLLLEEHADEIATWLRRETGSVMPKVDFELHIAAEDLYEASSLATRSVGELMAPGEPGQTNVARRVPLGVVGVITPWNSPVVLATRAMGPALALGNAVVLKPDIRTPVTGGVVLARLFEEAGLPAGNLQVVPGAAEAGEALVTNQHVAKVSFTGSTRTGQRISEIAAPYMKSLSLELGGNNAYIVLDDADIELAASAGAFGSFLHSGQICFTAGRHVVHERIAEEYAMVLAAKAEALPVGDPMRDDVALGPIINKEQLGRVDRIVVDTVEQGAELLAGGSYEELFYRPTVLTNVSANMPAWTEEIFGPVAPITTFASIDEAVALANDSGYGLVAAVQTKNLATGLAVADRLRTGIVHINDQTVGHLANSPIGGVGMSGNGGRLGSPANLDEFTQWQWLTFRDDQKAYPF